MNKLYLLLSKNKETGPYTLDQLRQLSLQPNDLVWVQGQSAGWNYPSELPELKDLSAPVATSVAPPPISAERKSITATPVKPKRDEAKKVFVSLPSGFQRRQPDPTPSLEDKAEAIRQKALNYTVQPDNVRLPQEEGEVRYTRTLTDIKQEYNGWLDEQKKERRRNRLMPLLYTAIFAAVIAGVFFAVRRQPGQKTAGPAVVAIQNNEIKTAAATKTKGEEQIQKPVEQIVFPQEITTVVQQQPPADTRTSSDNAAPVKTVVEKKEKPEPQDETSLKKMSTTMSDASLKEKKPVRTQPDVPVTDLIETASNYVQTDDGIALAISFRNKSAQEIKVAAVDVFYFDKDNVKLVKQTLYFSNVPAGATVTRTSQPQKAASASYRLGLVSAERGGLYVQNK